MFVANLFNAFKYPVNKTYHGVHYDFTPIKAQAFPLHKHVNPSPFHANSSHHKTQSKGFTVQLVSTTTNLTTSFNFLLFRFVFIYSLCVLGGGFNPPPHPLTRRNLAYLNVYLLSITASHKQCRGSLLGVRKINPEEPKSTVKQRTDKCN